MRGCIPDFRSYMEGIIRKTYTIDAMMLFPKHDAVNGRRTDTFNQARGKRNNGVEDR